jgi:hypothetical protein
MFNGGKRAKGEKGKQEIYCGNGRTKGELFPFSPFHLCTFSLRARSARALNFSAKES